MSDKNEWMNESIVRMKLQLYEIMKGSAWRSVSFKSTMNYDELKMFNANLIILFHILNYTLAIHELYRSILCQWRCIPV